MERGLTKHTLALVIPLRLASQNGFRFSRLESHARSSLFLVAEYVHFFLALVVNGVVGFESVLIS